jgi:MFS family permease
MLLNPSSHNANRYLYGEAIGDLIFSQISESFGRKPLYIGSAFLYSGFCIVAGTVPHISGIIVGRFFSGLVSAIPSVVVAGSVEDMYETHARIWMIFAWGAFSKIGLTLGPIYSVYITEEVGWFVRPPCPSTLH